MKRATFVGAPGLFLLDQASQIVYRAFGSPPYLVGSALEKRDHRDVDVRVILDDAEYGRLFPGMPPQDGHGRQHPLWSLVCTAVSLQLYQQTGLPVDFQIQAQSVANERYPGPRSALGLFPVAAAGERGPAS